MKFNRIRKRKKPNKNRLVLMLIILLGILYIWLNAENLMKIIF